MRDAAPGEVFVGMPVYRVTPAIKRRARAHAAAASGGGRRAVRLEIVTGIQTHVARSELMGRALDSGASWFLSLDHDIACAPSVLEALFQACGDVVAAPYKKRSAEGWALRSEAGPPRVRFAPGAGRCVAIECAALGCTLITRRVLVRLCEYYGGTLDYVSDEGAARVHLCEPQIAVRDGVRRATEEDYAFSDRVRAVGMRIEALADVEVTHAGLVGSLAEVLPP